MEEGGHGTVAAVALARKRAVIAAALPCVSCGYNLQGQRVERDCPECGTAVVTSLETALDPQSAELPELAHPRAIGRGLVLVTSMLLLVALAVVLGSALEQPSLLEWRRELGIAGSATIVINTTIAVASILGMIGAVVLIRFAGGAHSVRMGARQLIYGLAVIAVLSVAECLWELGWVNLSDGPPGRLDRALLIVGYASGAMAALYGISAIIREIGQRCRLYRESQLGVQRVLAMIVALVFIIIGCILPLLPAIRTHEWLTRTLFVVVVCSTLMVLIGLVYLVMNARWISRAIRHPSRRLGQWVRIETDSTSGLRYGDSKP
ncbi:MAG: hypothetical protein ACR2GY_01840 [Phycisphaerales bacterium]